MNRTTILRNLATVAVGLALSAATLPLTAATTPPLHAKALAPVTCLPVVGPQYPQSVESDPADGVFAPGDRPDVQITRVQGRPETLDKVIADLIQSEYEFSFQEGAWWAPNRQHDLRAHVTTDGLQLTARLHDADWHLGMRLTAIGRPGMMTDVNAPRISATGARLQMEHAGVTESYNNDAQGIEQGFSIPYAPASLGSEPVVLSLSLSGSLKAQRINEQSISFNDASGKAVVRYDRLVVRDASGTEVPATLVLHDSTIEIRIHDSGAAYPLTVDPILAGAFFGVAGGQAGEALGTSVASAGDINGDGLKDVIIGSPLFDNGAFPDSGRVLKLLGNPGGTLTLIEIFTISPTDPLALNSWLGYSVSTAGDYNGDGRIDVVVGAPKYDNGTVVPTATNDCGRVYILCSGVGGFTSIISLNSAVQVGENRGWSVSSSNTRNGVFTDVLIGSPLRDNGTFIDTGLAGFTLGNAAATTALFAYIGTQTGAHYGTSMSSTDYNGDGFGDMVVGTPDFDATFIDSGLLHVSAGSAGGPTTLYGYAPFGQTGGRVGFSVGGGGDLNNDGFKDLVGGAPNFDAGGVDDGIWITTPGGGLMTAGGLTTFYGFFVGQSGAHWGGAVAINGNGDCAPDAFADMIIAAPEWDDTLGVDQGVVVVNPGTNTDPSGLNPGPFNFVQTGFAAASHFGASVAWAGDTDGDGISELLAGAPSELPGGVARMFKNPPPSAPGVTLNNPTPTTNQTITATVTTPSVDPDGEPVTQYKFVWKRGATVTQTTTTASLSDSYNLATPCFGNKGDVITVSVTAKDCVFGSAGIATATVQNTPPVVNAGPNQGPLQCTGTNGRSVTLAGSATDADVSEGAPCNFAGDTLTYTWKEGATTIASGPAPTVILSTGFHTLTLQVNDGTVTVSATMTVNIVDTVPPVLSSTPANVTVQCDAVPAAPVLTASDLCDGAPAVSFNEVRTNGSCPNSYSLARTWRAIDASLNVTVYTQTVTVIDTVAPTVNPPASKTVECPAPAAGPNSEAAFLASVTGADNCGSVTTHSNLLSITPGCGNTYVKTYEFFVTDECSNASAHAVRTYTVVDTTAPTVNAPANKVVECPPPSSGPDSEAAWMASVTGSDSCGSVTPHTSVVSVVPGCGGTYVKTVDFFVTDACNNASAPQRRTYTVIDTTPPVVTGSTQRCLWPPNHSMVHFNLADFPISVVDACGGATTFAFTSCTSNQPDDAPDPAFPGFDGDGNTTGDCVLDANGLGFQARAERCGTGPGANAGRNYTLRGAAVDACGNASASAVIGTVHVPHSQSLGDDCSRH